MLDNQESELRQKILKTWKEKVSDNQLTAKFMTNRIFLYCPMVTEKSTNTSVKLFKSIRGMDKIIWHQG